MYPLSMEVGGQTLCPLNSGCSSLTTMLYETGQETHGNLAEKEYEDFLG